MKVKRGDIYFADLENGRGSEQSGARPVLIIQNDIGNLYSPTIIVALITSSTTKKPLPTHVALPSVKTGLPEDSIVLLEQLYTIDKKRLGRFICHLGIEFLSAVGVGLKCSLGLSEMNEEPLRYKSNYHKESFKMHLDNIRGTHSNKYLAALFLITSNKGLWRKIKKHITEKDILLKKIDIQSLTAFEYKLLMAASDVLYGYSHFSISDITDPYFSSGSTLEVVLQALRICRYGYDIVDLDENNAEEKHDRK